jgi:hypothetical protein
MSLKSGGQLAEERDRTTAVPGTERPQRLDQLPPTDRISWRHARR